jgi:acetyl esterase/lipase
MTKKQTKDLRFYRKKWFLWTAGSLAGLVLIVALAFRLSPWPGALIIRTVFNRGGHKTLIGLQQSIPPQPVNVLKDQRYGKNSKESLDVYIPNTVLQTQRTLPVVIWTHGGAWLSGDKKDSAPYFSLLASREYIVVSLNYSLAPGETYPLQLHQLNAAYTYIQANASRFHANTNKIVFAGDSAGAQLSSQAAAIITDPEYAREVGIQPTLKPSQLAGVILFCGIYKMEGLTVPNPTLPKIISWGNDTTVWAYLGTRDKNDPLVRQASTYYHVTKAFPATFISGGNGDPLTNAQSVPLSQKLTSLGVPVITLFYPQNHMPSLPHEYQFTFNDDGKEAFTEMTQFLKERTQ